MDEGRKRVLAIVAGILVARHLKTADDPVRPPGNKFSCAPAPE
jgi:hypothetical protein